MSLKQEIETWVAALAHYDNNEFEESLQAFDVISDTSKILFNCGVIRATLGEHERAVECYQRAVALDQYLAIAYFQQGVSNFLMGDFEEALANFNDTLLYLRGNNNIDYDQLGLKFKLYSCEVLFNRGLCYLYLQQRDTGMVDLSYAAKEKATPDHDVIDEAIREQAEGYTVFSIPVGVVYRPNEAKVKNLRTRDYLGKARLVAAADRGNTSTGFAGVDKRRHLEILHSAIDDRPAEKLSYAAANLSEPPINRNLFPPTPPPEAERPVRAAKRASVDGSHASFAAAQSLRNGAFKPPRLDLGIAAFEGVSPEKPRIATVRSASERPRASRGYSNSSARSRDTATTHRRSVREAPSQRAEIDKEDEHAAYPEQLLKASVYQPPAAKPLASHLRSKSSTVQWPMFIDEEEEDEEQDVELERKDSTAQTSADSGLDHDPDFDMLPPPLPPQRRSPSGSHRASSRPPLPSQTPTISRIRIKILTAPSPVFDAFADQLRVKFALRRAFRIKVKDEEGDWITLADQDDLDLAVEGCVSAARRERAEMGKLELWIQEA
ncbi:hypothetical protein B0A49_04169 [Cryomyces minteri]|uniref:PB1 domain-containing protein n=1 Tax=Cryomyces minteri TaxID=331657 RepID=A0A4U0X6Z0_9PEZI|nr:hypothetical protein B0A49_04169 [Cryomyces minteri]